MIRHRIGLIALAAAWEFIDGLYAPPRPAIAIACLVAGLLPFLIGSPRWRPADRRQIVAALAALLLLQGLLVPIAPLLATRFGDLPALSPALATAIEWLGGAAAVTADGVRIERGGHAVAATLHIDQFAPLLLLRLAAGFWIAARFLRPAAGGGAPIPFLIRMIGFALLRVLVLLLVAVENQAAYLFVEPVWTVLTWLPFGLVPWSPRRETTPRPLGHMPTPTGRKAIAGLGPGLVMGLITGAAVVVAIGFADPGHRGGGRLLIDESHGRWETTTQPFDTLRYGRGSLYNYRAWRDWLARHYRVDTAMRFPGPDQLARTDVLIVKTPTEPYRPDEVERIRRFVQGGGGLLLIGDHTNLFGMGEVLNRVARPFGIAFRFDDTFPLQHGGRDRYRPPRWLRHPAVPPIPSYGFETSCTLRTAPGVRAAIVGRRLGRERVNYSHRNFFGNLQLDLDDDYGAFVQMASATYGDGRVLAFTDSTNFSNFSFFWPGRSALAVSMVEFLNRRNSLARHLNLVAILVAMGTALYLAERLHRGRSARALAVGMAAIWIGAAVAAIAVSIGMQIAYRSPPPICPPRIAWFDRTWSAGLLDADSPILKGDRSGDDEWDRFHTLFIDTARSGFHPAFGRTEPDRLAQIDLLVILHPNRPFRRTDLVRLDRFVRRGGTLLVLDSIRNHASTAAPLLARFGLHTITAISPGGRGTPHLDFFARSLTARIGNVGPARVAVIERGRGRLVAVVDAAVLSDAALGAPFGAAPADPAAGRLLVERLLLQASGTPIRLADPLATIDAGRGDG